MDYQPLSTRVIRRGEGAGLALGTYLPLSLTPIPMSDSGEAGGTAYCPGQGSTVKYEPIGGLRLPHVLKAKCIRGRGLPLWTSVRVCELL